MPRSKKPPRKLIPRHELFCQLYVKSRDIFCNATWCYAEAYGYDLESKATEPQRDSSGKTTGKSERQQAEAVCAVEGGRLLRNPRINRRITELLNEMLEDAVVDGELAKTILQDDEITAKIAAIREYNKLRQRIIDKSEVIVKGAADVVHKAREVNGARPQSE